MEENKKVIEKLQQVFQELRKDDEEGHSSAYELQWEDIEAIENVLNRLEQLEKENKELKDAWCLDYKENLKIVLEQYVPKIFLEKDYIIKSKIQEILKQRLNKYQEADDGIYKQDYLTRGELELVDRYKECSELYKLLYEEDVYKLQLDYISKSKIEDKIKELDEMKVDGEVFGTAVNYAKLILKTILEE